MSTTMTALAPTLEPETIPLSRESESMRLSSQSPQALTDLWLLSKRFRAGARLAETLAASAISRSTPISGASSG